MRIHIGNLPNTITLTELVGIFESYYPVSAFIAIHADTGMGRGFGFIEVPDQYAQDALGLDGQEFAHRQLRVSKAEPRRRGDKGKQRSQQA